jgi:hypothetical protein
VKSNETDYPDVLDASGSGASGESQAAARRRAEITIEVATGTVRRVLYSALIGGGPSVEGYGALLRTDSSGQYILFAGWYFLAGSPDMHGWLYGGKTHPLVPSQLLGVPIAW